MVVEATRTSPSYRMTATPGKLGIFSIIENSKTIFSVLAKEESGNAQIDSARLNVAPGATLITKPSMENTSIIKDNATTSWLKDLWAWSRSTLLFKMYHVDPWVPAVLNQFLLELMLAAIRRA